MKLIVGLGNPGAKYTRNRHNVGFLALDAIAAAHGYSIWRGKFQGQIAEGRIGGTKAILLKPETFMNLSGDAVQAAMAFHKIAPKDVIVLHDELDLEPGKVRVKTGGGHAGHNGIRSIAGHVGPDFVRVRIGVGHPGDKKVVTNHVLGDFAKADADWLDPLLAAIARAAPDLAAGDLSRFSSEIGQPAAPAPAKPPRAAPDTRPKPDTAAHAVPQAPEAPETPASPLQRLIDRFR